MRPTRRSDRVLMVLAIVAATAVSAALWFTRRSPNGGIEWVTNPYRSTSADAQPADSSAPSAVPETTATATTGGGVEVVRVLTTPQKVVVGQMTPECKRALKSKGAWRDAAQSEPWPECIDASGRPMVVQFCSYLKLSTGEWLPSSNTRNAPRCQAELSLVRQGKLPGAGAR